MVYQSGGPGFGDEQWVHAPRPEPSARGSGATAGVPGFGGETPVVRASTSRQSDPPKVRRDRSGSAAPSSDEQATGQADGPAGVTVRLTTTIPPRLLRALRTSVENFSKAPVLVEVLADEVAELSTADRERAGVDGGDGWVPLG